MAAARQSYMVQLDVDPAFIKGAEELKQTLTALLKSIEDALDVVSAHEVPRG